MPEFTTPPVTSPDAPATPKPKTTRGTSNQEFTNELKDSQKVAQSAIDSRYSPGLIDVEMDATLPASINTLASSATTALGKLKAARTGRKTMTKQEKTARTGLITALGPIQSAAKRAFSGENETLRANYGIGEALASQSLKDVTITCKGILARLLPGENNAPALDVLPGVKPDKQIKALADAIALYGAKDLAQGDEQNTAATLLETIKTDIAKLAGLRRQIQLAADQAWPWRTKSVATIRKAFLLPKDRPLTD